MPDIKTAIESLCYLIAAIVLGVPMVLGGAVLWYLVRGGTW